LAPFSGFLVPFDFLKDDNEGRIASPALLTS
jgi:hypothetical protein